jgi:hypothetical protein
LTHPGRRWSIARAAKEAGDVQSRGTSVLGALYKVSREIDNPRRTIEAVTLLAPEHRARRAYPEHVRGDPLRR